MPSTVLVRQLIGSSGGGARLASGGLEHGPRLACRPCRRIRRVRRDGVGRELQRGLATTAPRHEKASAGPSPPSSLLPENVAVLGGGLTGLAAAYYLTRYLPAAKVTLYEATDRLGGWIDTVRVPARRQDDGTPLGDVYFERGARSIKTQHLTLGYEDLVLYDLVQHLGLSTQLGGWSRGQKLKRLVFYPDHLVDMSIMSQPPPGTGFWAQLSHVLSILRACLTEPLMSGALLSGWRLWRRGPQLPHCITDLERPAGLNHWSVATSDAPRVLCRFRVKDVSIGEYASGFVEPELAGRVGGALIHGLTGGDIWKLSMAHCAFSSHLHRVAGMKAMQEMAAEPHPTVPPNQKIAVKGIPVGKNEVIRPTGLIPQQEWELLWHMAASQPELGDMPVAHKTLAYDLLAFRNGLQTLTDALASALRRNPNVTIHMETPVQQLQLSPDGASVNVTPTSSSPSSSFSPGEPGPKPTSYDKVIATIPAPALARMSVDNKGGGKTLLPTLARSHAVTMILVNLYYPPDVVAKSKNRFGQPSISPGDEFAFGYLLPPDTPGNHVDALGVCFDSWMQASTNPADTVPRGGAKLTVMMGGRYWDERIARGEPLWSESEATGKAMALVEIQLGLPASGVAATSAKLCRDAIPQHFTGHGQRMAAAHGELLAAFAGRLSVAGSWYQNPGVLPTLRGGRDVAAEAAGWWWAGEDDGGSGGSRSSRSSNNRSTAPGGGVRNAPEERSADARWAGGDRGPEPPTLLGGKGPGETGLARFTRPTVMVTVPFWNMPFRFGFKARFVKDSLGPFGAAIEPDDNIELRASWRRQGPGTSG